MKTSWPILVAVVLGALAGLVAAVLKVQVVPWDGDLVVSARERPVRTDAAADALQPKAHVASPEYDFGAMDAEATTSHHFELTNQGMAPLTIAKGPTTCSCVLSELPQSEVLPGQSVSIRVEWTAKGKVGPFAQSAAILTNDPDQPRLTLRIKGQMRLMVEASPPKITFSQVSAAEPSTSHVRLYSFLPKPLQITGFELSDAATLDKFDVALRPLTSSEVRDREGATSGVLVSITAKSGLPLGAIRQRITLQTNAQERPTVVLPVQGVVTSDLAIFGQGWDGEAGLLSLGTIAGKEGKKRSLVIVARGPHRKEVKYSIVGVAPAFLKVELGATEPLGNAHHTPLRIEVPAGTSPGAFLDVEHGPIGRIEIDTTHPDVPHLRLFVSFSVEG